MVPTDQIKFIAKLVLILMSLTVCSISALPENKQLSLDELFSALAKTTSEYHAKQIEQLIWSLWFSSDNEKVNKLMDELIRSREARDYKAALALADQIVKLEPDNAEGWNQRATALFLLGNYERSLEDIVETLEREPRHFGALSGRAYILLKQNKNRQAIETINTALKIHPFLGLRHTIPNIKNSLLL